MGKNLKYGEFTFSAPKARPTVAGYAHGGATKGQAKVAKVMGEFKSGALHSGSSKGPIVKNPKQAMAIAMSEKKAAGYKKGGEPKMSGKSVKLVGMKMEPEAVVKKEVALLKKAGAPTKLIKHEEREGALMGLKKGGKPKRYAEGGSAESDISSENVFREVNGKYMHNNQEISKADFDRRKAAADAQMQRMRGADRSKMPAKDRARSAFDDLNAEIEKKPYKKGGRACYAEGGGAESDKELAMKEDIRAEKALRDQQKGYKEHYKREEAENLADRKAAKDALMYIPRKIGQGAQSLYEAAKNSDAAKGLRNYGRLYKEGLGMKPDTPYEKKKGGEVHSDVAMDKKVISKAVHKHEAAMHPGKPMTKLKKGGDVKGYAPGGFLFSGKPPASGQQPVAGARPNMGGALANSMSSLKNATSNARTSYANNMAQTAAKAASPMAVRAPSNANAPMAAKQTFVNAGQPPMGTRTPMKKGGAAKKGVPTFNRNPKC